MNSASYNPVEGIDYFVHLIPFPNNAARAIVVRNCDSTYSIFINRALPPELQLRSKEHEVEHIRNNDFDNSEYELELIERLFS